MSFELINQLLQDAHIHVPGVLAETTERDFTIVIHPKTGPYDLAKMLEPALLAMAKRSAALQSGDEPPSEADEREALESLIKELSERLEELVS